MKANFLTLAIAAILVVTNLSAKSNKVSKKLDATCSIKTYGLRVVDAQTKETVPFANVIVKTANNKLTFVKADINGYVNLSTVNSVSFTANVSSFGFDNTNNVVINLSGASKDVVISLAPTSLSVPSYDEMGLK